MNQETANYIMQRMSKYLDNSQMIKLKDTLDESLRRSEDGILEKSSQELLDMFIATKRLEGRSEKTLFLYRFNIENTDSGCVDMGIKVQFQIMENGIKFKRLIGSRVIPFSDIRSIRLLDGSNLFTTQSGEEIKTVKSKPIALYEAVITNNISFYDETEHEEKYYTREELNPLIAAATKVASKVANDYIKEHLGDD